MRLGTRFLATATVAFAVGALLEEDISGIWVTLTRRWTLFAWAFLSIAIVAPMSLAARSLASAYYSRDQITSFYLAQEAIEALRSIRDAQILEIAEGVSTDIFGNIPVDDKPFTIDARKTDPSTAIVPCPGVPPECPSLQTDLTLYGYESGWDSTYFTRNVRARTVSTDVNGVPQEIRVTVTVTWKTGGIQTRSFSISENLYRWINDGISP